MEREGCEHSLHCLRFFQSEFFKKIHMQRKIVKSLKDFVIARLLFVAFPHILELSLEKSESARYNRKWSR